MAANNLLDFCRELEPDDSLATLPSRLGNHVELYKRAARLTDADIWPDPQCARAACITALMAGIVTLLPLMEHCLEQIGCEVDPLENWDQRQA